MIKNLLNRNLNKYTKTISEINALEDNLKLLSDIQLKEYTLKLRHQYHTQKSLSNILAPAFALTRESSRRNLDLRHYDVQLIGGLVLNDGKIAEMRTGEGKTLVSTLPAYLNALTGKAVHIVTVNDYLANRDEKWVGQVHRELGLQVGLVQENMDFELRKLNYNADITYVTNSELGFDYLRDNTAISLDEVVQRSLNYCIVDEVDSILIDEAKTPLILSGYEDSDIDKYIIATELAKYLQVNSDFEIDAKNKNIFITETGIIQTQKLLKVNDLFDPRDPWMPFILNALKANFLFLKNIDYIIKNDEILIVDESTGRPMPDRRWSDGLHQSIEAKEGVAIMAGTKALASVTYQNFFSLYSKLSGMTGTAKTDEAELEKTYGLSVIKIPTNEPSKRQDLGDKVFGSEFLKWRAVVEECKKIHKTGQPLLIGTVDVEKSQIISQMLEESDLPYRILNAKPENIKQESEIIAKAGERSAITIATNMAGRGTDIVLGGNSRFTTKKQIYQILVNLKNSKNTLSTDYLLDFLNLDDCANIEKNLQILKKDINFLKLQPLDITKLLDEIEEIDNTSSNFKIVIKQIFTLIFSSLKILYDKENQKIKGLGGLYILGTERHESRRIDDQLRGRCGRQGDPGTSCFFLSLDDTLLRNANNRFFKQYIEDGRALEGRALTKSISLAQKSMENRNYDVRKNVFDYDQILSKQRLVIFSERENILETPSIKRKILGYGNQIIAQISNQYKFTNKDQITLTCENLFGQSADLNFFFESNDKISQNSLKLYLQQQLWLAYEFKEAELQNHEYGLLEQIEESLVLQYMDAVWKDHLVIMGILRDNVGWRGYGQRNPLDEYRSEGFYIFRYIILLIERLIIYEFFHLRPI